LLLALAIEHAAEHDVRTVDLLRGNEAYKHLWHSALVPTYGCTWLRSSTGMTEHGAYGAMR
jgi:hypothetical protein